MCNWITGLYSLPYFWFHFVSACYHFIWTVSPSNSYPCSSLGEVCYLWLLSKISTTIFWHLSYLVFSELPCFVLCCLTLIWGKFSLIVSNISSLSSFLWIMVFPLYIITPFVVDQQFLGTLVYFFPHPVFFLSDFPMLEVSLDNMLNCRISFLQLLMSLSKAFFITVRVFLIFGISFCSFLELPNCSIISTFFIWALSILF